MVWVRLLILTVPSPLQQYTDFKISLSAHESMTSELIKAHDLCAWHQRKLWHVEVPAPNIRASHTRRYACARIAGEPQANI